MIGLERPETMRPVVERALQEVTDADPWLAAHPPEITWRHGAFEPSVTDPAHPAVVAMAHAADDLGHGPAVIEAVSAATDGRHLANAGGIPSINFGPGQMFLAHSPHEALRLDDLRRAIEIAALAIARYCGVAGGAP